MCRLKNLFPIILYIHHSCVSRNLGTMLCMEDALWPIRAPPIVTSHQFSMFEIKVRCIQCENLMRSLQRALQLCNNTILSSAPHLTLLWLVAHLWSSGALSDVPYKHSSLSFWCVLCLFFSLFGAISACHSVQTCTQDIFLSISCAILVLQTGRSSFKSGVPSPSVSEVNNA